MTDDDELIHFSDVVAARLEAHAGRPLTDDERSAITGLVAVPDGETGFIRYADLVAGPLEINAGHALTEEERAMFDEGAGVVDLYAGESEHVHEIELVALDSPDMLERKLASLGNPPRPTIDANLIQPNVTDARTGRAEVRVRLSSDGQLLAKQIAAHFRTNWLTVVYVLLHRELDEVEAQMAQAKGEPLTDDERQALHQAKQALVPG